MRQALGPGALGRPRGIGWRGRREGGLGWGIHVNPWLIHINVWQASFNFMVAITISSDFRAQENKISHCCHFSPSTCHEVMGLDAMVLVFWMLSFKPTFSLSSFTFIRRLFSSSSLSAIRVVSPAYLSLLIFLLAVLITACAASSQAFCKMYSAYTLNKQGDNIQLWHTPFPILNQWVTLILLFLDMI